MLGLPVEKPDKNLFDLDYVGIKASQFSFNRLQKADPVLGVDMASTGEVGCLGDDTNCAILKAMLSVGYRIPEKSVLLSTGGPKQKVEMLQAARQLQKKGYKLYATGGTAKFLTENGVENTRVYWPSEEGQPQALDMIGYAAPQGDRHGGEHPQEPYLQRVEQRLQDSPRGHRPEHPADHQRPPGQCLHQCILHDVGG